MTPDLDKHKVILAIGVLCLFSLAIITAVILLTPKGGQCMSDGYAYPNGSSFKSSDGCNTCSCSNGEAVCTEMACDSPGVVVEPIEPSFPMKGIEVYCWVQGNAKYYTILPGTNRMKTYTEVTDPRYSYGQDTGTDLQLVKATEAEARQFLEVQGGMQKADIDGLLSNCSAADDLL